MPRPSPLGLAIEAVFAADPRLAPERAAIDYLSFWRTRAGAVVAVERVTKTGIRAWLPFDAGLAARASADGLAAERREPYLDPARYGLLSSLESVFDRAALLSVRLRSTDEARRLLALL